MTTVLKVETDINTSIYCRECN